ncbi:MAG: fatty acid desaturase [Pseudomonadota bacterium]
MAGSQIDHKTLVASLSDEVRVALTQTNDSTGLFKLASHVFALMLTSYWILSAAPLWQMALILQGVQIVFLFTLLHETVHDTPFASATLNRMVGWMCGLLIFLPPTWFRYFHLAHHRHTHDPEKDPELQGAEIDSIARYLWVVTGIPVWGFHFKTLIANAFGKSDYPYLPNNAAKRVRSEAQLLIGVYGFVFAASLYFANNVIFWLWIVPILLGQPFLRLYLMAEHGRCPHVANMFENTRTTFTNRIIRWLAWNMPYHAEHHAYPSVPFHKLPLFHKVAKEHLRMTENGYTAFHKYHINSLAKGKT